MKNRNPVIHAGMSSHLFLTNKDIDRSTSEIPVITNLVFQESFIRIFHPLWQIAEEDKRRNTSCRQLRHIFNLNIQTILFLLFCII